VRSLRGRLVAILLAVALLGMIVLALVTFTAQRSFLYDRIDKQLETGFGAMIGQLSFAQQLPDNNCSGELPSGTFTRPDDDNNMPDDARGGPRGPSLPPGTYGALLSAEGKVIAECVFAYGETTSYPLPKISGAILSEAPQTVSARDGEDGEFRVTARALSDGEQIVVAVPTAEAKQTLSRLVMVESVVIASVLLLLGIAAWMLVGIGLRPLDRMGQTADAIAGGDLTHRVEPADESSEIGRLGLALNRMLGRLEGAFSERQASEERLRQFLSDASHELRTPLVSIRGYAELHNMGASTDPEEVDRSMKRIEQEATRMGVLVEDMLALARLDETLDRAPEVIDLGEVVEGAVRDARVSAPSRTIELATNGDLKLLGVADQLQQVVANLLGNAVLHTPDGTKIEVLVRHSGDEVRIDVRDHGAGLPDGVRDQIFERFWRAERGRKRGAGGSGLGLAIVNEIVNAHGGRVHATNADGGGAVFSVWLPATTIV
jgi:two-component system OmpR family sensor kinase